MTISDSNNLEREEHNALIIELVSQSSAIETLTLADTELELCCPRND